MEQKMRPELSTCRQFPRSRGSRTVLIHDNFEIFGEISADATGTLYKSRFITEDRQVAIRLFSNGLVPVDNTLVDAIPGILPALPSPSKPVATDGTPFVVMEMPQGICLERLLNQKGVLPISASIQIALNVALVVRALHVHGVVHGHLCAQNIFVRKTRSGPIEVQLLYHQMAGNPSDFNFPQYLSPTLFGGSGGMLSSRDDLWAIAVLLYRMLLGIFPFGGDTAEEIRDNVCRSPLRLPMQLETHMPHLVDFLLKSLAKSPEDRPDGKELNLVLKSIYARRRGQPDAIVPFSLMAQRVDNVDDESQFTENRTTVPVEVSGKSANPVSVWTDDSTVANHHGQVTHPSILTQEESDQISPSARPQATISAPPPDITAVMSFKGDLASTIPCIDTRRIARQEQLKLKRRRLVGIVAVGFAVSVLGGSGYLWLFDKATSSAAANGVANEIATSESQLKATGSKVESLGFQHDDVPVANESGPPADVANETSVNSQVDADKGALSSRAPENVTIALPNLPVNAHVLLNGMPTVQPVVVPKSENVAAIAVVIDDRIIYSTTVPTTHDQVVEMIVPKNRSDRAKQKRKRRIEQPSPVSKSGGKDVGNLSSNPYRLRKNPFKTE